MSQLPIQMRRRGLPVLGEKRGPGEGVEDERKRLRAPYNAKGAEEWGWAFGIERGKGNVELGLDAVASHPWSGGCPIMSVSTLAFLGPRNGSLSPEKSSSVSRLCSNLSAPKDKRSTSSSLVGKTRFFGGPHTNPRPKETRSSWDHHDRSQMVSSLRDPQSHPRFGPIPTRSRTTCMENLHCVLRRT